MSAWYIAEGNESVGPFSTKEIRDLVASGDLTPDCRVRRDGMTKWVSAGNVKGLFGEPVVIAAAKATSSNDPGKIPLPDDDLPDITFRAPRLANPTLLVAAAIGGVVGFLISPATSVLITGAILGVIAAIILDTFSIASIRPAAITTVALILMVRGCGVGGHEDIPVEYANPLWAKRVDTVAVQSIQSHTRFGGPMRFVASDAIQLKIGAARDIKGVTVEARRLDGEVIGTASVYAPPGIEDKRWETVANLPLSKRWTDGKIVVSKCE